MISRGLVDVGFYANHWYTSIYAVLVEVNRIISPINSK